MTTFTRAAVAIATSATLILAPMSAAHASSFGSSSNGATVAPVDPPKQPVEETPAPVDTDAQVAEKIRSGLVEALNNSGNYENDAATDVAEALSDEALANELTYLKDDYSGQYSFEGARYHEGNLYAVVSLRMTKEFAAERASELNVAGEDLGFVAPFGVDVKYNEDYYFVSAAIKAF